MSQPSTDLAVRRRSRWGLVGVLVVLLGVVGLAVWHAHHPMPLPTETRTVSANTPVDEPVYVGVANGVEGRTLNLSGVKVHTTSNTAVSVTPLLCRDGRLEATTDPTAFCADLVNPEGQTFGSTDSIVLQVVSPEPAIAVVDPVRLGFRESLQWGTFPTGAGAVVRVLSR
ncbi:hypothetical protein [Nocardioides sp.]|jgi:hypothetical protein|uniref:hypothetical protein n=1 Tax=Nocardioides sp. TaxID=35761 RepID=UPI001D3862AE|nr:hypothetical protein [Nocardioides sp.]MBU1801903.1 hypothetical protein [Actinomycetota bacterium]